jgi:hypothetical protein
MSQWDRDMNLKEFMAVYGQAKRDLKRRPEEWFELFADRLDYDQNLHPLTPDPWYTMASGEEVVDIYQSWAWFDPVAVTAAADGSVAAVDIVAAGTGRIDAALFWKSETVSGAGQHLLKFANDPTGTPTNTVPFYDTVVYPMLARHPEPRHPMGLRVCGGTADVGSSLGIATLAAGSWPNNCKTVWWGFYRDVKGSEE